MPLKIGLCLPATDLHSGSGRDFAQVSAAARRAEELGFDSAWLPDHLFIQVAPGQRRGSIDALAALAAIGAQTSRLLLGTLVVCNGFRNPGVLAKTCGTIQDISQGRFILGLGAGWHEPEYEAFGFPFDHRVSRLEESAEALHKLFRGETVSMDTPYYTFRDAELLPRPPAIVPLWIAAAGERMMHITARIADGWNFAWCGGNAERLRRKVEELRRACIDVGRNPDQIEISAGVLAMPLPEGADVGQAFERLQDALPQFRSQTLEQFRDRVLAGPREEIAAGLRRLADAGAQHLLVSVAPAPFGYLDPDAIDRLGAVLQDVKRGR